MANPPSANRESCTPVPKPGGCPAFQFSRWLSAPPLLQLHTPAHHTCFDCAVPPPLLFCQACVLKQGSDNLHTANSLVKVQRQRSVQQTIYIAKPHLTGSAQGALLVLPEKDEPFISLLPCRSAVIKPSTMNLGTCDCSGIRSHVQAPGVEGKRWKGGPQVAPCAPWLHGPLPS